MHDIYLYLHPYIHADTDECVQSGNPCHLNAECTDTDGGFACQCLPGFEGDGHMTCQSRFLTSLAQLHTMCM